MACSSPFKRRSLFCPGSEMLRESDNEAERRMSALHTNLSRKSMGTTNETPAAELLSHFMQCIKMSTENKINQQNAFSLPLIDYMINMMNKKDSKMDNFQFASVTLEASAKIYASRVDRIHVDGMKIAGGLVKAACVEQNLSDDGEEKYDGDEKDNKLKARRRKKVKKVLITDDKLFSAPLQKNYKLRPSFMYMTKKFSGCRPGCVNFLSNIGVQNDLHKLKFLCLEKLLAPEEQKPVPSEIVTNFPQVPDIRTEKINHYTVEPSALFDDEISSIMSKCDISENLSDTDALAEKLKLELQLENNFDNEVQNPDLSSYSEVPDDIPSPEDKPSEIVRHLSLKPSDYSYFNKDTLELWTGPSHWKVLNAKAKAAKHAKKRQQKQQRDKRKDLILFEDTVLPDMTDLFQKGRSVKFSKLSLRKWHRNNFALLSNEEYDPSQLTKLYLRPMALAKLLHTESDPYVLEDDVEYDYKNPNDTLNYCPNVETHDYSSDEAASENCFHGAKENAEYSDGAEIERRISMTEPDEDGAPPQGGWKLLTPPPNKAEKVDFNYKLINVKKPDIYYLKKLVWSIIMENEDEEVALKSPPHKGEMNGFNKGDVKFSDIMKKTKSASPEDLREGISPHLVFCAILHLINEKQYLRITSSKDEHVDFTLSFWT